MERSTHIESIWRDIEKIRESRPLVHNITNSVVTNFTANCLLALGASPLMAHAEEELEEIVSISNSLVLNIGTLDNRQVNSMKTAIVAANSKDLPIVIDPVGAGATKYRTATAKALLQLASNVAVRGNASEILAICGNASNSKGVDSQDSTSRAYELSATLIDSYDIRSVVVSGEHDFVVGRNEQSRHSNGHLKMTQTTGTGCALTAITGAFLAVNNNPVQAAQNAISYYGVSGELAAKNSTGPGSFSAALIDSLQSTTKQDLSERVRVEWI